MSKIRYKTGPVIVAEKDPFPLRELPVEVMALRIAAVSVIIEVAGDGEIKPSQAISVKGRVISAKGQDARISLRVPALNWLVNPYCQLS